MADQLPKTLPIPPPPVSPTVSPLPHTAPVAPIPPPPIAPIPPPPVASIPPPPIAPIRPPTAPSTAATVDDDDDGYEVSEAHRQAKERQEKAIQDLLLKRRAFAMAVPTNDSAVRSRLRRLGEPITLFGEREMERRDRLRSIMVRLESDGKLDVLLNIQEAEEAEAEAAQPEETEEIQYPFFTEADLPGELHKARLDIALYSLARAKSRVDRAKRIRDDPDEDLEKEAELAVEQAQDFVLDCSEIADARPLSGCSFSKDGSYLATSSWSGSIKIWSMPNVQEVTNISKAHEDRATDVAFSPDDNKLLATASADRTAKLWDSSGKLLTTFNGHLDRLGRIAFHPSGKYLGTASFDKTWRLWDVCTGKELLLQEGHSRSVYSICFHLDGSLAASCGLDALVRVWDLRTGRSILAFEGHVKPVLGVSFSPNGYHLATGSEDNFCRIWDLRKRKNIYSIPAHKNLISQIKYEPQEGYFLATSSYDSKAALWSAKDFKPIKVLDGHEAKVTGLDITNDGQKIATVAHDRTIKIWSPGNSLKDSAMDLD
ncbi:WD-40 repeat family protein / small nuclear ribonucleoprotein Prp4p-like protein [Carex rostrata]